MSPPKPVTIYDVAKRAGVSIATVSRVLQGSCPVSLVTSQKVLNAVEELDYVPLRGARPSSRRKHEAHGLVLPGLEGPYFSDLLVGYESTANQYGQAVVVATTEGRDDLASSVRALAQRVDGIALTHGVLDDVTVRAVCRTTPTVLVGRAPISGCDSVTTANSRGAEELTTHLVRHGRRHLLFAGTPETSYDIEQRYTGFVTALARHGLSEAAAPLHVHYDEYAAGAIADAVAALPRVDTVICANDEMALSAMALLSHRGVAVPDDVALVGFDDIMAARYVSPGLTTVRQPTYELGRWAAIRLHERILGRGYEVQPQVLPTRLIVRGSCGCAWSGPHLPDLEAG